QTGEDRHSVPLCLAVVSGRVAAPGQIIAEELNERVVGELGLLEAHDVRLPLVQPRQQPRHPLLDRVYVPGRHPHRSYGSDWVSAAVVTRASIAQLAALLAIICFATRRTPTPPGPTRCWRRDP